MKWGKGFVSSFPANEARLKYLTKYILKGNDREDNFMLCSKRPAIGSSYVKPQNAYNAYRKTEDGVYAFSMAREGGRLVAMPRYYKKKFKQFFDELEYDINQIKTIKLMEERDKYYYLEKKFKDKGGFNRESNLENTKEFQRVIHQNYMKDYKKQIDINNDDKIWQV